LRRPGVFIGRKENREERKENRDSGIRLSGNQATGYQATRAEITL
jgi:hypothetical protein